MNETDQIRNTSFKNTFGLIICGGQSSRMGTDKSLLQYFDKPQRYHVYDMLVPFCEKVFISCSKEQAENIDVGYNFIQDDEAFGNIGPMAGLLTAFTQFPKKNILLIGCDYPFLNAGELEIFSMLCKDIPASFYNQEAVIYESMLAWYPYTCFKELNQMFAAKEFSLQQLLRKNDGIKYIPADLNCIRSIDTMEAYTRAIKELNAG